MTLLKIVYGPDPIFQERACLVEEINDQVCSTLDNMIETMYHHNAIGLGANMLGILQRLVVVDIQENDVKSPLKMINPKIIKYSKESSFADEGSVSFPGIKAKISRANNITVTYKDCNGDNKELFAQGLLARVIQHEVDYLDGKIFLDYLSPLKKRILLAKIKK